jgi:hypothetical protein
MFCRIHLLIKVVRHRGYSNEVRPDRLSDELSGLLFYKPSQLYRLSSLIEENKICCKNFFSSLLWVAFVERVLEGCLDPSANVTCSLQKARTEGVRVIVK